MIDSPPLSIFSHKQGLTFFLTSSHFFNQASHLEVLLTLYPLSSSIDSTHFRFEPYEDYVAELTAGRKSTYRVIQGYSDKVFGILLSLLIASGFWLLLPGSLSSVEAIVALLGAYAIGKEFWRDLDRFLQRLTQGRRVQWSEHEFAYVQETFGTIQRFWQVARRQRYGYTLILPKEFDLISHSNSKTIELAFDRSQLTTLNNEQVRILTVELKSAGAENLDLKNVLISTRIRCIRSLGVVKVVSDYYQGLNKNKFGSVDAHGAWQTDLTLIKRFVVIGRLKINFQTFENKQKLFSLS